MAGSPQTYGTRASGAVDFERSFRHANRLAPTDVV
jgi:hypothetical protein